MTRPRLKIDRLSIRAPSIAAGDAERFASAFRATLGAAELTSFSAQAKNPVVPIIQARRGEAPESLGRRTAQAFVKSLRGDGS